LALITDFEGPATTDSAGFFGVGANVGRPFLIPYASPSTPRRSVHRVVHVHAGVYAEHEPSAVSDRYPMGKGCASWARAVAGRPGVRPLQSARGWPKWRASSARIPAICRDHSSRSLVRGVRDVVPHPGGCGAWPDAEGSSLGVQLEGVGW